MNRNLLHHHPVSGRKPEKAEQMRKQEQLDRSLHVHALPLHINLHTCMRRKIVNDSTVSDTSLNPDKTNSTPENSIQVAHTQGISCFWLALRAWPLHLFETHKGATQSRRWRRWPAATRRLLGSRRTDHHVYLNICLSCAVCGTNGACWRGM